MILRYMSITVFSVILAGCVTSNIPISTKPEWITENNVGYSSMVASGLKSDQEEQALLNALFNYKYHKGLIYGVKAVRLSKNLHKTESSETYKTTLDSNGVYKVYLDKQGFKVKITNKWYDKFNDKLYIQIEDVK
jgi:hypothetical protein